MKLDIGIELEFLLNKEILIEHLNNNNIEFVERPRTWKLIENKIVIKEEPTLRNKAGIEINIPPTYSFEELKNLISLLNSLPITFNKYCAMHIHVSFSEMTYKDTLNIFNYYLDYQDMYIRAAIKENIYSDLNIYATKQNRGLRKINLNASASYIKHKTIEHRIYKSTIDLDKIIWAVEQTKSIVLGAMKEHYNY